MKNRIPNPIVSSSGSMCRAFAFSIAAITALSVAVAADTPKGKIYTYKPEIGEYGVMEVYFPKDHDPKKQVPGIIMFHGGGWRGGSREQFRFLCDYFASRGLVAATAEYRLGQGKRTCITDAKSAIRWYKKNASQLGIDPMRIITGGGSAGGHISLLATTTPGLNDPKDPKDIDTSVVAYLLFNPALSPGDENDGEIFFENHLKAEFPPAVVFFGTKDEKWLRGWNSAYKKMNSLGVTSVDWLSAEGKSHAFFNKEPWRSTCVLACDRFLIKQGLIEGEPTLPAPKSGEALKPAADK